MPPKYALDTNLFIDAFRNRQDEDQLVDFHRRHAPAEFLSAVVALELRAGVTSAADMKKLQRNILAPFETRGRVFAPSYAAWKRAGAALAELARRDGLRLAEIPRGFYNDVLIAASCCEHGIRLVTRNVDDYQRIKRVLRFEFMPAWI